MKKWLAWILIPVILLGTAGCKTQKVDRTTPVFKTEDIACISFTTLPKTDEDFLVPEEYKKEIISWLGTFRIGEEADPEALEPGSDSISVRIEYTDGTVIENGLTTVMVDGVVYYMSFAPSPECYFDIFSEK